MDETSGKEWIVIATLVAINLAVLVGLPYATYRYGRFAERRLLTAAFMQTMEQDYYVGYHDAEKACRRGDIR